MQRPPGRLPPEVEEGPAEVRAGRPALPLELVARHRAQRVLGEVAHRQREALLAAMLAVQRAHRHVRGPRQLLRPHRVVAPLPQQHRHVSHEVGMALLPHPPHDPSPSSPSLPERLTRGMKVPSATVCVAGGADMPRRRLPPEGGEARSTGPRLRAHPRRNPVASQGAVVRPGPETVTLTAPRAAWLTRPGVGAARQRTVEHASPRARQTEAWRWQSPHGASTSALFVLPHPWPAAPIRVRKVST